MNEENALQADEDLVDENQSEEITDENVESAPANIEDDNTNDNEPGEEGAETPIFNPEQQAIFDNAIGKKVGATRAAERRAEEAERKLAEINANVPDEIRPAIPPMPDQFAENFDELVKTRDKAIADATAYDVRQETQANQRTEQTQRAAHERQQAVKNVVDTYTDRAKTLGITPDDLEKSGAAVAAYGIDDSVILHILNDEKGPAVTKFLAENPLAMDKLNGMNPMQAAVHIENVVKPAALKMKQTTNAPAPSTNLAGGGSPPSGRGPKGATFE